MASTVIQRRTIMPIFRKGELFSSKGCIIVTTCSFLTSECKLVMGRGAALQLKKKIPGIDRQLGRIILEKYGHLGKYGLIIIGKYGIAQVKYRFDEKADPELIRYSMDMLKDMAGTEKDRRFNINFPGIGYGGLTKDHVLPLLKKLPRNVTIWEPKYKIIYPDFYGGGYERHS